MKSIASICRNIKIFIPFLFATGMVAISAQTEEDRNYPLGPIGGDFRVTPGSSAARVVWLDSNAPGYAAGLREGDYIQGAFGKKFTPTGEIHYGFTQDLGFAVDRAESGDGTLPLMVIRPGVGALDIDVQLPAAGAFGPVYPINSPKYDAVYESAVAHIHQTAMDNNGSLGYFTGWMGLCLLGHPDWNQTSGPRPYRNSVNAIRDHVVNTLQGANYSPNEDKIILADGTVVDNPNHVGGMSNWQLGQMVTFLAEYYTKTADESVMPTLQRGAEICANTVQWWKQPALAGNGYSPETAHVSGMVSHGGVTGDYIHLGWGGGFNICGAYTFNGLSFARAAGVDMEARPRDGHDFGYDVYPDELAPVVPPEMKGYRHTLDEKFMLQWDFMGRRSMTRSTGSWGDGHIWYLAGQGSTTWDAAGRSPGTLLGMAMYQHNGGVLSEDDADRVERIKGYISRAYMWQQESHAYSVGAQAYQAMAAAFLSDRQLRYFMDNWRFFYALSRTHDNDFRYFISRSCYDNYLNQTHCASINIALPHAVANGRLSLLPGYNTDRLVVQFDHPDMTWPSIEAREIRLTDSQLSIPFEVFDGLGEAADPAEITATWSGPGSILVESFGDAVNFTDRSLNVFNQQQPIETSNSLINNFGSYNGFSVQFDDSNLSINGGELGVSDLTLNELSILRSGRAADLGSTAVYAKVYTSRIPTTATWVGDSTNSVNLNGGISDLLVTFDFDSLAVSSDTPYYIYFADQSGNLDPDSVTWRRGRLRISNNGSITYPSGNLINSWSNVDTSYDLVFSAALDARSYTAPASTEQEIVLPGEGTYTLSLAVSDGTRSVEEPIRVVMEAASSEPPSMAITAQPVDVTAALGESVELSISTAGPIPAIYQWRRNGIPFGQPTTSPTLNLTNISGGIAGVYDCVYTTEQGVLTSETATVTVSDAGETVSGGLWWEAYTGISGTAVSALTSSSKYPLLADASTAINSAVAPINYGDNYGQRWTGWLVPTVSGRYRFYVSHDDSVEVWLGEGALPESASRILAYSGTTIHKRWSSRAPSEWVDLVAGQEYYFEVLLKEGSGSDHCAVAWQLDGDPVPTDGSGEIPGEFFKYRVGGIFSDELLNNAAPVFSQESYLMPGGTVAEPYTASVAGYAVDPDADWDVVSYSLVSGPSWLSVAADGTLSGTAGGGSLGDNSFVIRATDKRGLSATATIIIPMSQGALLTGGLWRDVYTSIGGDSVDDLTNASKFPLDPDSIGVITSAAAPTNAGSSYGQRWTGWLTPATSGRYRFYLASDDSSQLFLGTTDEAESSVAILSLSGYTGVKEWSARAPSEWIELVAGQIYYIEVLHKEGGGGDHCAVAWQLEGEATPSNGSGEIPGQFLSYRAGGIFSSQIYNNQAPEFTQASYQLSAAAALVSYSGTLAGLALDPNSDWDVISYSLVSGPSWLTVAADGSLSGTPGVNVVGTNTFTVSATDKRGLSDTATISIEVLSADYYYDINGSQAGSGAASGGNWNDAAIWTLDPNGESETVAWIDGATAVFSAGGDATGSYPINLTGEKIVGGLTVQTGLPQLVGGQITLEYGDTSFEIDSTGARIDSVLAGSDRGLVKSGMGSLVLGGSNTFTGNLRIFEGVLELANSGKLYTGGNNNTAVVTVDADGIWRLPDFSYAGVGQLAEDRQRRVIDGGTIEVTGASHSSGQDFTVTANGGVFRYTASGQTLSFTGNNNTDILLDGPTEFETLGDIQFEGASALLEGTGPITKTGSGRLVIANDQSYSAAVAVADGELLLAGSISSPISIADGASLTGFGSIEGSITAAAGATLAPDISYQAEFGSGDSVDESGLLAHWQMDEADGNTITDSSSNNINGTLYGPTRGSGVSEGGLTFDGVDDSVGFGTGPSLSGKTDFTLSAWVKTTADAEQVIIQQRDAAGYNGQYQLRVRQDGTVFFYLYGNSSTQFDFYTNIAINDGEWHHVVAVRDGEYGFIYIDGDPIPAATATGTLRDLDSSISVGIGRDIRDNNKPFNGQIDEVKIYNVAKSGAEVRLAYRQYTNQSTSAVLTTGPLNLNNGATLRINAGSNDGLQPLNVVGDAVIGGAILDVSGADENNSPITLLSYSGTRSGEFDPALSLLPEGWEVAYDDASKSIQLVVSTPSITFAEWIATYDVGAQTGLMDDPDGDGLSNEVEFELSLDPTTSTRTDGISDYLMRTRQDQVATVTGLKFLRHVTNGSPSGYSISRVQSTSQLGGLISYTGGRIQYTPPLSTSGSDSFAVALDHVSGAVATVIVNVVIAADGSGNTSARNPARIEVPGNGDILVRFVGIPGRSYTIQRSRNLENWTDISVIVASPDGVIEFRDTSPLSPSGYYRLAR